MSVFRAAVTAAAALLALVVLVQVQAQTLPRIARIGPNTATAHAPCVAAFKDGMRELGLQEGQHYLHEERYAEGHYERFAALTAASLQREPALIMVATIASAQEALRATRTVPILFVGVNDPVGSGLVASLARPGGNATGLSNQSEDLMAKYLQLLRETLPRAQRVALLFNPGNASNLGMLAQARAAAGALSMQTQSFDLRTPDDLAATLTSIAAWRPDALLMIRDAVISGQGERISAWANARKLPTFAGQGEPVRAGIMMSYAAPLLEACRRSAQYAKKILAGARPADLPVEQPTRFELTINLKSAKAIGLTIPPGVLLRADEVIE